jgi:hypothetical protein
VVAVTSLLQPVSAGYMCPYDTRIHGAAAAFACGIKPQAACNPRAVLRTCRPAC